MGFSVDLAPLGQAFEAWGQRKYGNKISEFKQLQDQAAQAINLIKTSAPDSLEYQRGMALLQQVESQVVDDPEARAELQRMGDEARIQANIQRVQSQRPDLNRAFPLNNPRNPTPYSGVDLSLQGNYSGLGLFDEKGKPLGVGRSTFESPDLNNYYMELKNRVEDDNAFAQQLVSNASQHLRTPESITYLKSENRMDEFQELIQRAQSGDRTALNNLMELDKTLDDVRDKSAGVRATKLGSAGQEVRQQNLEDWNTRDILSKQRSLSNSMTLVDYKESKKEPEQLSKKVSKTLSNREGYKQDIETYSAKASEFKNNMKDSPGYEIYIDMATTEGIIGKNMLSDLQLIEQIALTKYNKSFVQLTADELSTVKNEFKNQAQQIADANGYELDPTQADWVNQSVRVMFNKIQNVGVDSYLEVQSDITNAAKAEYMVDVTRDVSDRTAGNVTLSVLISGVDPISEGINLPIDLDSPSRLNPEFTNRDILSQYVPKYEQLLLKESQGELTRSEQIEKAEIEKAVGGYVNAGDTFMTTNLSNLIQPNTVPESTDILNNQTPTTSESVGIRRYVEKQSSGTPSINLKQKETTEDLINQASEQLDIPDEGNYTPEAERYLKGESQEVLQQISKGNIPKHILDGLANVLNTQGRVNTKDRNAVEGYVRNSLQRAAKNMTATSIDDIPAEDVRFYK